VNTSEIHALAIRFFDAIERGDIETVREIYADDAVIWHNTDGKETTRAENLSVLNEFIKAVSSRRYTERRLSAFEGGFVEQHRLVGSLANGAEISLPACIVCTVANGRITRLDEYFDSAVLAKLRG
jgi:ketosteroid isomerase-like protein